MKTFIEYISENHPGELDEGMLKKLAIGGALLGAGMGIGSKMGNNTTTKPDRMDKTIQSQSVTSDDAASYLSPSKMKKKMKK